MRRDAMGRGHTRPAPNKKITERIRIEACRGLKSRIPEKLIAFQTAKVRTVVVRLMRYLAVV